MNTSVKLVLRDKRNVRRRRRHIDTTGTLVQCECSRIYRTDKYYIKLSDDDSVAKERHIQASLHAKLPDLILPVLSWTECTEPGHVVSSCKVTPIAHQPSLKELNYRWSSQWEEGIAKVQKELDKLIKAGAALPDPDWSSSQNILIYKSRLVFHDFDNSCIF